MASYQACERQKGDKRCPKHPNNNISVKCKQCGILVCLQDLKYNLLPQIRRDIAHYTNDLPQLGNKHLDGLRLREEEVVGEIHRIQNALHSGNDVAIYDTDDGRNWFANRSRKQHNTTSTTSRFEKPIEKRSTNKRTSTLIANSPQTHVRYDIRSTTPVNEAIDSRDIYSSNSKHQIGKCVTNDVRSPTRQAQAPKKDILQPKQNIRSISYATTDQHKYRVRSPKASGFTDYGDAICFTEDSTNVHMGNEGQSFRQPHSHDVSTAQRRTYLRENRDIESYIHVSGENESTPQRIENLTTNKGIFLSEIYQYHKEKAQAILLASTARQQRDGDNCEYQRTPNTFSRGIRSDSSRSIRSDSSRGIRSDSFRDSFRGIRSDSSRNIRSDSSRGIRSDSSRSIRSDSSRSIRSDSPRSLQSDSDNFVLKMNSKLNARYGSRVQSELDSGEEIDATSILAQAGDFASRGYGDHQETRRPHNHQRHLSMDSANYSSASSEPEETCTTYSRELDSSSESSSIKDCCTKTSEILRCFSTILQTIQQIASFIVNLV